MLDRPFVDVFPEEHSGAPQTARRRHCVAPLDVEAEATPPLGIGPDVASAVAGRHGVTVDQLLGRAQSHLLEAARGELYAELYANRWSYPEIGRFVRRDQSTVRGALMKRRAREAPSS